MEFSILPRRQPSLPLPKFQVTSKGEGEDEGDGRYKCVTGVGPVVMEQTVLGPAQMSGIGSSGPIRPLSPLPFFSFSCHDHIVHP